MAPRVPLDRDQVAAFCRKWRIRELSLFGSVLRDDFRPNSDADVLVTYGPDAEGSLLDHIRMEEELGALLGVRVDLVTRRAAKATTR